MKLRYQAVQFWLLRCLNILVSVQYDFPIRFPSGEINISIIVVRFSQTIKIKVITWESGRLSFFPDKNFWKTHGKRENLTVLLFINSMYIASDPEQCTQLK